jgi:hypothetical protein
MHLAFMDPVHVVLFFFPLLFLVGLSLALHRWPPKAINPTYGYRTRRSMATQEAWDYAQPRSIDLITHWTWWMVLWTPLVGWRWGLESGILILSGLMTAGVILPLCYVERELKRGKPFAADGGVHGWGTAFTLFVVLSVMKPIEHDGSEPERIASGTVESVAWSVSSQDVFFRLRGDECHYYINRGLGMGIDTAAWKSALVGREVKLEVVDRPAGLNWLGSAGPVRGVILGSDTLYRTGLVRNP